MAKTVVPKSVDVQKLKPKVFSDVSMMSGVKMKGIDTTPNQLIIKTKVGKVKVTTGKNKTVVESSPRFFPIFIWDVFLDRIKTKKVHQTVLQIVTAE